MSEDEHIYATPDLTKVSYGRGEKEQDKDKEGRGEEEDRGEWKDRTVDIYVTGGNRLDPDSVQHNAIRKNPAREQRRGSDEAKNNLDRVAAVCLGLLCLILSVVIIALVIHFTELIKKKDKLTEDPSQLKRMLCELSGWKAFGRGCYYISTEKKTWGESRQYCKGNQTDLMVINSKEKQDFVISFNKLVWLGLKKKNDGTWTWVDETPLTTPKYWGKDDPDNSAKCVALVADGSIIPIGWYNSRCSTQCHWICERVL